MYQLSVPIHHQDQIAVLFERCRFFLKEAFIAFEEKRYDDYMSCIERIIYVMTCLPNILNPSPDTPSPWTRYFESALYTLQQIVVSQDTQTIHLLDDSFQKMADEWRKIPKEIISS